VCWQEEEEEEEEKEKEKEEGITDSPSSSTGIRLIGFGEKIKEARSKAKCSRYMRSSTPA
jgi:hypothetical protein